MSSSKNLKWFFIVLLAFLSAPSALAASPGFFQNNPFLQSLWGILGNPVSWPPWNATPGLPMPTQTVPVYVIFLVWIALFSLIYVVANIIPPFKDTQNKNAVVWFSFAFAGIAVTSTTFVNNLAALIDFGQGGLLGIAAIVLLFLLIGILFSGSRAGLGWMSPGKWGSREDQLSSIKTQREVGAAKRDAGLEENVYKREDDGIRKAETLIATAITATTSEEDQLKHLLDIIEQLQKVRDQGEAARLKEGFQKQASAVAARIAPNSKIENELEKLIENLERLDSLDFGIMTDMSTEATRLTGVITAAGAAATTADKTKLQKLKKALQKLTELEQEKIALSTAVHNAIGSTIPESSRIRELIEAAIRDVYSNVFPQAIQNINQALSEIKTERDVLTRIGRMFTDTEKIVKNQRMIVRQVGTYL